MRELCGTLLSVSSGIFNSSPLPLSGATSSRALCGGSCCSCAVVPHGGSTIPWLIVPRFRRSGCLYRCSSFSSLPSHKLTLTGSPTPRPPKVQPQLWCFPQERDFLWPLSKWCCCAGWRQRGAAKQGQHRAGAQPCCRNLAWSSPSQPWMGLH